MVSRAKKTPVVIRHEDKASNRVPPLLLAFCLAVLLAGLSALPRVRPNLRLAGSLWGASAGLILLLFLLWREAARTGRTLRYRFIPVKAHYVQLGLQFCFYSYWGWYWQRVYPFLPLIAAQIAFVYVLDMLLTWWRRDEWILGFGPLPIVLSTNLFLWFKDDWFFLQFLLVATGVICKQFIKWDRDGRRTHIFNPSAIALFIFSVGLIATNSTSITWGQEVATTFGWPPNVYLEIFLLGVVVQALFSVTLVTLSSAAVLYALSATYTHLTGVYFFVDSNIPAAVFLGLHLLVTDPATSPRTSLGKVVFGGAYGAAVFALYGGLTSMGAPGFYDKLLCVPVLNLTVRWLDRWARAVSGRFRWEWTSSWSPRRLNFAHMGVWIALFAVMLATGFLGRNHPGRDSEFWHKACQEGKWGACKTWAHTLEVDCRGASAGDCRARVFEFYRLFSLGKERANRGEPGAAIPLFQSALVFSPQNLRGNTELANALAQKGRLEEAIAHYRKVLDVNPQHIEALTNLGVALADQGKLDEALACYERVLEMDPRHVEARADMGIALSRQGKLDEAVVQLEKALAMKPDFAQAHINLGVVLIQKGRLEEAIGHLEDALKTDPGNGEAQGNLGLILLRTGKLEDAILHLEKALAATPDSPELQTNLGGALAERGQLDRAIDHFEKAVELAPDSGAFRANLAAGLVQSGRWKEATAQFERALALTPDSSSLHTSFGMALLEHGSPDGSIPHFERALALAPDDAQVRYYLGSALRLQGRTAEALAQWRQALVAQPDLLQALDEAAWVMATSREPSVRNGAKAVELAERAVQVSGGQQPRILATLAASYAEAGQFPKAVETAHRALNLAAQQNNRQLAGGLNAMIVRYEAGAPFRDAR